MPIHINQKWQCTMYARSLPATHFIRDALTLGAWCRSKYCHSVRSIFIQNFFSYFISFFFFASFVFRLSFCRRRLRRSKFLRIHRSEHLSICACVVRASFVDDSHGQLSHILLWIVPNFSSFLFYAFSLFCDNDRNESFVCGCACVVPLAPHEHATHTHDWIGDSNEKDEANVRRSGSSQQCALRASQRSTLNSQRESCANNFEFGQFFFIVSFIKWKAIFPFWLPQINCLLFLLRPPLPGSFALLLVNALLVAYSCIYRIPSHGRQSNLTVTHLIHHFCTFICSLLFVVWSHCCCSTSTGPPLTHFCTRFH